MATGLINAKAGDYLNRLFDAGLIRRSFVTYMPDMPIIINEDSKEIRKIKDKAYKEASSYNTEIINIFHAIPLNAAYQMTDDAYDVYSKYQVQNNKIYNEKLGKADDILLKEIRGRFWKTAKLSTIIASLQHPKETIIKASDMEYAIYQSELFAKDFEQFFKAKPKSDTEMLFIFLLDHQGKWISKQEIRKQKFVNNTYFSRWFIEQLEYIRQTAIEQGYILKEESFYNNVGVKYSLVKSNIDGNINPNIIPINDLLQARQDKAI